MKPSLTPAQIALFAPLFPLFFVALWIFVCFVVSLAGWRTLAPHFRAIVKPDGQNLPMQGAEIGMAQYNGCLSVVIAETGLWMQPWLPFRAFHPPLLLPWRAFESAKVEKRFWAKQWTMQVLTPGKKRVKIVFPMRMGELVAARVAAEKSGPDTSSSPPSSASPWS